MNVSLLDFLIKLQFGEIKIGSTPQEVKTLLGPPERFDDRENRMLWAYGTTEFFFARPNHSNEDGPIIFPKRVIGNWSLNTPASLEECRDYLQRENIAFEEVWHDPVSLGVSGRRVTLTFCDKLQLHSFSLAGIA